MAEANSPGSPGNDQNSAAAAGGAATAATAGGAAPARPDWAPEKFWDPAKGELRTQDLAKAHGELEQKLGKGRDGLKAEIEAERLKARPAKPEDYAIKLPEKGAPAGLVLLDKAPGEDFKPEEGKKYFVVDQKDPLLAFWRDHAHQVGLSNDDFMKGVMTFAEAQAGRGAPSEDEIKAFRAAEWKKLGDHGEARAQHAWGKLVGIVGEDKAKALEASIDSAPAIEALEQLLEKAGEPRFSPGSTGAAVAGASEEDARKIMREPDYWQSPAKQAQVAQIYKRLYPGQVQTAQIDRRRA